MLVPPVDDQLPPIVEEGRRNWSGWICLGFLVALTVIGALSESLVPKPLGQRMHEDEQQVLQTLLQAQSRLALSKPTETKKAKTTLDEVVKDARTSEAMLIKQPDKDRMAAKLAIALESALKVKFNTRVAKILQFSKVPTDKLFYQIYRGVPLSRSKAEQLTKILPESPFVFKAAKVHLLENAGDKTALTRLVPVPVPARTQGLSLLGMGFLVLSVLTWSTILQKFKDGSLNPKGIPMDRISKLDADRLAVRAAQIFAMYLVIETGVSMLPKYEVDMYIRAFLMGALMLGGLLWLQRVEVDGKRISLEMLGITRRNLKSDLMIGFFGFVAEFPVALIMAGIGSAIFSFLPKATHPASEALARDHSFATVIPVFFLGVILAPLWEEIVFRGLIFPALKRLLGGIFPGILVSSFLFASMHPQGISIWLSLASIGAASCLISYQSRSLVPSMVMHFLHNSAVLCIALLVT